MKKIKYYLCLVISLFCFSCGSDGDKMTDGLWLRMGDNSIVSTSDIDFYDVSTHMIYLKSQSSYLKKIGSGESFGTISVYVGPDKIYQCPFVPIFSSSIPQGVMISGSPFMKEDIIRIGFNQFSDRNNESTVTDPRSDERIIAALKRFGQYHEGLHCEIESFTYSEGKLALNIVLSNHDTFDYYYLDPDKMGLGLFHYFTNGALCRNLEHLQSYTHHETVTVPEPWNAWKKEWLSLIKSGERKNIPIVYNHFANMPVGQYRMFFEFPGLYIGKSQKEAVLADGRIWMGGVCVEKLVAVD